VATVNNQIGARTGAKIGSPQANTLETGRDLQLFIVYPGRSATQAQHVMIGIGRKGTPGRLYDPQQGTKFANPKEFGPFISFPIFWRK
jgi:hypothetical protein